jgi:putative serine protease PepD
MQPRSSRRTFGALLLGALLTLAIGAGVIVSGVVHLPERTVATQPAPTAATPTPAKLSSPSSGTLSALYRSVADSVAYVQSNTAQGTASGSGFLLDTDGHIVTNEHVVEGASAVQVRLGEKGSPVDAQVVGADPNSDVAVLKIDAGAVGNAKPLALGDSSALQIGQSAVAIGSPFGLQGTLTTGIVSALHRQIQSPSGVAIDGAIQTDAAINPGNSGGPLLDTNGRVIGINAQIASESGTNSGVGFAIPIDMVKSVAAQIESGQLGQQSQQQQVDPSQQQVDPSQQQVDPSQQGGGPQVIVPSA